MLGLERPLLPHSEAESLDNGHCAPSPFRRNGNAHSERSLGGNHMPVSSLAISHCQRVVRSKAAPACNGLECVNVMFEGR